MNFACRHGYNAVVERRAARVNFNPQEESSCTAISSAEHPCAVRNSFRNIDAAKILYQDHRNGLLHEARRKGGCQFALSVGQRRVRCG